MTTIRMSLSIALGYLLSLMICCAVAAQSYKTDYGAVTTLEGNPVSQTEIRTDKGSSDVTTDSGRFSVVLIPPLRPGFPITFSIKNWAIVDPCDKARGRMYLPDPDAPEISITALKRGDKRLLAPNSIRCIIVEKAARFVRRPAPPTGIKATVSQLLAPTNQSSAFNHGVDHTLRPNKLNFPVLAGLLWTDPSRQVFNFLGFFEPQSPPDDFLVAQSTDLGFEADQLSQAITDWGNTATDPYDQGLAAFYDGLYEKASQLIGNAISASDGMPVDRFVVLSRIQYELKNFEAARASLKRVLAGHPDDPLLLEDLDAINRASGSLR